MKTVSCSALVLLILMGSFAIGDTQLDHHGG
jgi:hypothetical protein